MLDVCVVLPCAGKGTRIGLPFPKELAPLGPDRVLIDSSLDLIGGASKHARIKILLLEDGDRELVAEYVRRKLPDVPLACVRQSVRAVDMSDAIIELSPWFGEANVLLLPDAIYEFTGDHFIAQVAAHAKEHGMSYGAVYDPPDLRRLGALRVDRDHNRVLAYENKPLNPEPSFYNAAWTAMGWSGKRGTRGIDLMHKSCMREIDGPVYSEPIHGAPVTWVNDYRDCGTWESYQREIGRETSDR